MSSLFLFSIINYTVCVFTESELEGHAPLCSIFLVFCLKHSFFLKINRHVSCMLEVVEIQSSTSLYCKTLVVIKDMEK